MEKTMELDKDAGARYIAWLGSGFGIAGATLLSLKISLSPAGYVFFMLSSVLLSFWAWRGGHHHQLLMQGVFTLINTNGLIHWVILPALN